MILEFIKQHTDVFKSSGKLKEEDGESSEDDADDWNPMMSKEQVLVFLQLAESLLK